jgi:hypothetical protein
MISPELLNSDASCMRFVSTVKARLCSCFLFIRMAGRISANVAVVNTCKYLLNPWRFEVWISISAVFSEFCPPLAFVLSVITSRYARFGRDRFAQAVWPLSKQIIGCEEVGFFINSQCVFLAAPNSELISGMHPSCFCQGLRVID